MHYIAVPRPLALLGTLALVASLAVHLYSLSFWAYCHYLSLLSELTTPEFPVAIPAAALTTSRSPHYSLNSSDDDDWSTLIPRLSSGFLLHPTTGKFYAVSLYHQLHCLDALRKYIAKGDALVLTPGTVAHSDHCLDYLRQALLCHADTTLEPVRNVTVHVVSPAGTADAGKTQDHIDQVAMGWDVSHRCRDWTAVRTYLEENYFLWPESYAGKSTPANGK